MSTKGFRILIVDDDESFSLLLKRILQDEGYDVSVTNDPNDALNLFSKINPNLVITDLKMPKIDGITLMNKIKEMSDEVDFIVITGYATVQTAVSAMKLGATDYITKPLKEPEELRRLVFNIYDKQRLRYENTVLKGLQVSDIPPLDIIFAGIEHILSDIKDVAPTDATVILYGETGVGKSLIAKVIHNISKRKGLFVDINCAAIPETLLESELFGYEKGAFTGAIQMKKGKFEVADDGTVFLDEVSEMSLGLQAKFLKVLQDKTFQRLGSLNELRTTARIIAATNRNLKEMVTEKRFREDLYYRLNVFPITIPPLRQRKQHIPTIAQYLLDTISKRLGKPKKVIDKNSIQRLLDYSWKGNIRELENVLERAVIISKGEGIVIPELEIEPQTIQVQGSIKEVERIAIQNALKETEGNRKRAADILGISLRALQYKIKEYGL
ncbi:MAG: sigma-54 dependent transcriptional regulator [Thermodesulfovibrionales bacterium]|nr:sigma-54 dependent transcriptional regulator [Thermodesulfovibrionales bacterium]